jgi:hypothetical protein
MCDTTADVTLDRVLASAESIELAMCITDLAQAGDEKGNLEKRLNDALAVFARYAQKAAPLPTGPDPARSAEEDFLKRIYENARKDNPHNIGMT